jgi:hypothetical protein
MSLTDPILADAATHDLKPRVPGRPPKMTGESVSVAPHRVGPKAVEITLSEEQQKQIALYARAFEQSYGQPPVEEQLLQDLIMRGIQTDENFKSWVRDTKKELAATSKGARK